MNICAFVSVLIKYILLHFWWHKPNLFFSKGNPSFSEVSDTRRWRCDISEEYSGSTGFQPRQKDSCFCWIVSCFSFSFYARGQKYLLKMGLTYSSFSLNIYSSLLLLILVYSKGNNRCSQQRFGTLPGSIYIHSMSVNELHLMRATIAISRLQTCRSEWLAFLGSYVIYRTQ